MPTSPDPKKTVAQGYDRIAEHYTAWAAGTRAEERDRYTTVLLDRLPPGATLLELGCGAGIPTTERLASRFVVTGVDISERQVKLAQGNVPSATFIHGDMTTLDLPRAGFDAVASFYAITHVPRDEHAGLLRSIVTWLRPGGLFVATMGAGAAEGDFEDDWLGTPMYFSHFDAQANIELVQEAGLSIDSAREEIADEDGTPIPFLWMVAHKPAANEDAFAGWWEWT